MKGFIEEYGGSVLIAVIIVILIVMASPIGTSFRSWTKQVINGNSANMNEKEKNSNNVEALLNVVMNDDGSVSVSFNPKKASSTYLIEFSYKNSGVWSEWTSCSIVTSSMNADPVELVFTPDEIMTYGAKPEDYIKFRITTSFMCSDSNNVKFIY